VLDAGADFGHNPAMKGNQPARVLHVAKSLGLGGTEKTMQLMASRLDRSRFEPFVYSPVDGERRALIKAGGVPVIVGGDLFSLLERLRPDIVHVHRAGWPEPELLGPVKRHRPRAVVETNVFGRFDGSPTGEAVDVHLFVSRFCLERYLRDNAGRADPARCRVLYNPIDTDLFGSLAPGDRDFSQPVAGRLSRDDPGKWSRLAFDTLPLLKRALPDFRFLVIGATPEFRDFARTRGLADNVEFLPPALRDEELAAFFGRLSHLAHANDTGESFGMAIAEAMASGLPVVTHPAAGPRDNAQLELVEHGVTGLVAATAEDYASAQLWLWRNPGEARRMGLAGREKAQLLYRAQSIARKLGDIYTEFLDRT